MSGQNHLAILLSGKGSNFSAILKAVQSGKIPNTQICLVISDKPEAGGLETAQAHNIPTLVVPPKNYPSREAADEAILQALQKAHVQWVALAGYNRIVTPVLINAYPGKILNIHPSLLPAYGGKGMVGIKVHEAVIASGEKISGCTVHAVTPAVDEGPILGQRFVTVTSEDTAATLAQKVLTEEHLLYPEVLSRLMAQSAPAIPNLSLFL